MRLRLCWAALLFVAGCRGRPVSVVPATLPVDWLPFRWVDLTVGTVPVPRASILVGSADRDLRYADSLATARAGGPVNQLQLDFGFSGTGAFGVPLRTVDSLPTDPKAPGLFRGTIRSLGSREDTLGVASSFRLGTVGLLFYGIRGLLIDQVEHRLGAPTAGAALPAELTSRMTWTDAREDVGRLVIPLGSANEQLGGLWYDPGSSLVPLLVDQVTWRRLTGRDPVAGDRRLVFPTADGTVVLVGAPTAAPFVLGVIDFGTVTVWRVAEATGAARPDRFGAGIVGVIGNQLFESMRLVYLNVRSKKLGVIR